MNFIERYNAWCGADILPEVKDELKSIANN